MTRYTFEEVSITGTRRWTENGKKRQQTKTFMQTINPYNRNTDGSCKTREQINVEIRAELNAWKSGPLPASTEVKK